MYDPTGNSRSIRKTVLNVRTPGKNSLAWRRFWSVWLLLSDIVNKVSGLRDPGIQGSIPGARKLPESRDFPGPGNPGIKH